MIDNFDKISKLLKFDSENDFYMLNILKRKKDLPDSTNEKSVRTIKSYCINSVTSLMEYKEEVVILCENLNSRAYIDVNRSNHYEVTLNMLSILTNRLKSNQFNQKNIFNKSANKS